MENKFNNIDESLLVDDERIVNYLKGKMTVDEEQMFLRELETNADLKAKAVAIARMIKGMKEVGAANDGELIDEFRANDIDKIKSIAQQMTTTQTDKAGKPKHITLIKVFSAAASFALLLWAGIGYNDYRKTTGLGEEYATEFSSSQIIRGVGENTAVEEKLTKLFENVASKKDMDNTLHDLALCWELATQDTYNDYTDYAPEIGWNLAIGYLKDNDKKNAEKILSDLTIVAPAGTAIGDKARELLDKVKNL